MDLFSFDDYRQYLNRVISSQPNQGWGYRSELAGAIGCQSAYLSRVLKGGADLSLEQADKLSRFLGHSDDENEYFLLLVERARAGTVSLRRRFEKKIKDILERRLVLKDRFKVKPVLSREDQATYYSAWYYVGVHVLLSVPEYRTRQKIAEALNLPLARVSEVLSFLVSTGLAVEKDGAFKIGEARIHVGTDSPLLSKHLTNWRLQAMQSVERNNAENLHYSSVVTLSQSDAARIRALLVKAIEECNSIVAPSPEEEMRCLSIDFFKITAH
jgi:uncharacterized protein (TIGR02147 family)